MQALLYIQRKFVYTGEESWSVYTRINARSGFEVPEGQNATRTTEKNEKVWALNGHHDELSSCSKQEGIDIKHLHASSSTEA